MEKKNTIVFALIGIVVIAILVLFFVGQGDNTSEGRSDIPEVTSDSSETIALPEEVSEMIIDVDYGFSFKFPDELANIIVHEQEVHGALTTEVFSMRVGETDIPLFCIDFGDETAGDWFGVLNTEDGVIPVVHTVFAMADDELNVMDESVQEQYFELMNSFSDVLNTIAADPRFTAEKPLAVGTDVEVKTTYLTLSLPGNMTVVETKENDTYIAMFYGEVANERTALYTVHIGDDKAESELGLYEIDGVKKPISVGSFDLSEKPNWTDDDYSAAYRMMDTINHVIETIMSSEQFSIPSEEPVQAPGAAQ